MNNQIASSTPLGPLQQQYQQPIYNNNNFGSYKLASTTLPSAATVTTAKNNFNTILSTQSSFPLPVVSVPAPFKNSEISNKNNNFKSNNNNPFTNLNNNNNNNLFNPNPSNLNNNKPPNGRIFDNHNPINNYQTTSPYINNQNKVFLQNHSNATKLTPATAPASHQQLPNAHFNQFAQQPIKPPAFNQPFANNNSFNQNQRQNVPQQQRFFDQRIPSSSAPQITDAPAQIPRKPFNEEPPSFKQQDFLKQYNLEQQRLKQQVTSTERNVHNSRKPEPNNSLEQKRLQLHYDINDYLSTDKFTPQNQYSPTSEQYRAVQTYTKPANHKPSYQNIDQSFRANAHNQKIAESFTQKYNNQAASQSQSPFSFSPTPATSTQRYDQFKPYQPQTQQRNLSPAPQQAPINQQFNGNYNVQSTKSPYPTQIQRQSAASTTSLPYAQFPKSTDNSVEQAPVKKFSTLVPKEYYAPTTFKPFNYFNVAKQINDNLSTPGKSNINANANTITSSTSTTHRTVSITSTVNRNPIQNEFARFQNAPQTQAPSKPAFPSSTPKPLSQEGINEDDGQYHPELYEKDFARYKIKNRKKQQQQKFQQQTTKQNNFNNFNNNNYQQTNSNRFGTSTEEEFLNTAHSQNIAASGNELRAANAKNIANAKQSQFKAPTISPNVTTTKKPQASAQADKDVSYDYAYYDSGNDTPHDYSEFETDFGKTRN